MRRLSLLAFCLLAACESAPVTGRSQMMLVSEGEERQMGVQAYRQERAQRLLPAGRQDRGLFGHPAGDAQRGRPRLRDRPRGGACAGPPQRRAAQRPEDLAGVGLAVAGGRTGRATAPAAMAALGAGATVGVLLPMSRAQESEADHIGLVLMAMAGYDPREAVHVWERMRALNKGKSTPEWLSTHPADDTRIADIKRWVPEALKYYRPRG